MVSVTFTGTEKKYQLNDPAELPGVIRDEIDSQSYPDIMGMTLTGPGAMDALEPYDTGFPCQISTYFFGLSYEGSSVNAHPDHVTVRLKKIVRGQAEPKMTEPVYAMTC